MGTPSVSVGSTGHTGLEQALHWPTTASTGLGHPLFPKRRDIIRTLTPALNTCAASHTVPPQPNRQSSLLAFATCPTQLRLPPGPARCQCQGEGVPGGPASTLLTPVILCLPQGWLGSHPSRRPSSLEVCRKHTPSKPLRHCPRWFPNYSRLRVICSQTKASRTEVCVNRHSLNARSPQESDLVKWAN